MSGPLPLTAVIAAMPEELAPLARRACVTHHENLASCRALRGWLGRTPVVLAHTGEGRESAQAAVSEILSRFPVKRLVVIGIAGGLSPTLSPGTVLLAREVWDGGGPIRPPEAEWIERLASGSDVVSGTVLSSEHVLCTVASKSAAWSRLPQGAPAAVDLKSASCARVAEARGVAYVVLRAVCDTAEEDLPIDLNPYRDAAGRIRRGRVLRHALSHPGTLPGLWSLGRRLDRCSGQLASIVAAGVAS